jgi:hypothetical protein
MLKLATVYNRAEASANLKHRMRIGRIEQIGADYLQKRSAIIRLIRPIRILLQNF